MTTLTDTHDRYTDRDLDIMTTAARRAAAVKINTVMLFMTIKNVMKKIVIKDTLFNVNMVYIADLTRKTYVCILMLL